MRGIHKAKTHYPYENVKNGKSKISTGLIVRGWVLVFFTLMPTPALPSGGQLLLTVVDKDTRKPIACRMHLSRADGRPKKIKGFPTWDDHFVFPGRITLKLPKGGYKFELERGPEYVTRSGHFVIEHFADDEKEVDLRRFVDMAAAGWFSGDLHARRPPRDIELLMLAEDLHVVPVATWWNDKVLPGGKRQGKQPRGQAEKQGLSRFDGNRFYCLAAGGFAWPGGEILCFNLPQPLHGLLSRAKPQREFPPPLELLIKASGGTAKQDGSGGQNETDVQDGTRLWV
ncbi:MAG: hypothetical protein U9N87_13600, partial [Planctomycetota bacterium]|nr:hypothetical protein [Planctomycetota bacterium]